MIRHRLPGNWLEIYDGARFELATSLGRLFRSGRAFEAAERYLHLGCGEHLLPGFLNTDTFKNRRAQLGVDLRFPLPFAGSAFSGIYAHHVVEHLSYAHARALFTEARRVLDSSGTFRVAVPDVAKFIARYASHPDSAAPAAELVPEWHRLPEWKTALEVLDYVFRDTPWNRHLSAWDEATLHLRLKEAGFAEVATVACGESRDPKLSGLDNRHWEAHSIYVEAVAP